MTVIAAGFDSKGEKPKTAAAPANPLSHTRPEDPAIKPVSHTGSLPAMMTSPAPNATPIFQTAPAEQPSQPVVPQTPETPVFDPTTGPDYYGSNDPGDLDIPEFLR